MTKRKKPKEINDPSWSSLKSLLDDESEIVREGILKFLQNVPESGREFLLSLSQGEDTYLANHAQNLIFNPTFPLSSLETESAGYVYPGWDTVCHFISGITPVQLCNQK